MESLGLDPSEPVPAHLTLDAGETAEQPGPASTNFFRPEFMDSAPAADTRTQPTFKVAREPLKKVSLQRRTIEEQIQHERHDRALDKWAKQQKDWEKFRHHASNHTGRPKEHLVVSRAEEHRERIEVMELLDRATPDEVKSGGASWYHSLRGEGTRFVQIGNMFSGLYLPIKLHKENYVSESVRKPLLRELHEHRNKVLESGGTQKTWRDEEILVQRLKRYGKKVKEHAPSNLGFHETLEAELGVVGSAMKLANSEYMHGDETQLTFDDEDCKGEIADSLKSVLAPLEEEIEQVVLVEGPNIEAMPPRLQFVTDVNTLSTLIVRLKNVGTAAITYDWKLNTPTHGFQESILPDDPSNRFTCEQAKGHILPGREVSTLFTFTSSTPGVFISSWRLHTYPELLKTITNVTMHGVANEGDLLLERRQGFCKKIHDQQVLRQVQEIIEDMVESVKLEPQVAPDAGLAHVQERLFSERNKDLGLYWCPHAWQRLTTLNERVDALVAQTTPKQQASKGMASPPGDTAEDGPPARGRRPLKRPEPGPPPRPPEELAPSPAEMLKKLSTVNAISRQAVPDATREELNIFYEKQSLSVDIPKAVREAQKRPLDRSPIWWAAHEVVTELVLSVPRFAAHARKFAQTEPMPFIKPPDADAAPEAVAEFDEKIAARQALREQDENKEKEAKASETFEKNFTKARFVPRLEKFTTIAKEASTVSSITDVAKKFPSIHDRFQPYLGRQNLEGVELGGNVVIYEADLEFLSALPNAVEDSRQGFSNDVLEQVKQRLQQGLISVLDGTPLCVIVIAHVGTPPPDVPPEEGDAPEGESEGIGDLSSQLEVTKKNDQAHLTAVQSRMDKLVSLERLLDTVKECARPLQPDDKQVRFVPHDSWLSDWKAFAADARLEEKENKVILLENMSAIPEELGFLKISQAAVKSAEPPADPKAKKGAPPPEDSKPVDEEPSQPKIMRYPWAAREGFFERVFREVQPEVLVQDSFSSACQDFTLHTGLWYGVPTRVVGPAIEAEFAALLEAMPALAPNADGGGADEEGSDGGEDGPRSPAPLLCAVGGGGFNDPKTGEETLMKKLKLMIGIAQMSKIEKDGVILALGGELAVVAMVHLLGLRIGPVSGVLQSAPVAAAVRETFKEIIGVLNVPVMLPVDLCCEGADGSTSASPAPEGDGTSPVFRPAYSLRKALATAAGQPKHLGYVGGQELCIAVDPEKGMLKGYFGSPEEVTAMLPARSDQAVVDGAEDADVVDALMAVPESEQVKDIGDATVECLKATLRRCRGILWNGSFGVMEEEKSQLGTRGLMSFVEYRLNAVEEEEDEDDEEDDEDEDEDGGSKPPKEKKEPDAEFEVAVVIGTHSAQHLATLMEAPSVLTYVSQCGEALLRIIRGDPLPGLLSCAEAAPPE